MQGTTFVLWSQRHNASLLSVPSAGWRRPFATHVASSAAFTAAVTKGDQLVAYARWPAPAQAIHATSKVANSQQHVSENHSSAQYSFKNASVGDTKSHSCSIDAQAAVTLQQPYHGRHINAVACLAASAGACAAVTASEDGTVQCSVSGCGTMAVALDVQCMTSALK